MAKAAVARNTVLLWIGEGGESAIWEMGYEQWVEMSPVAPRQRQVWRVQRNEMAGWSVRACMHAFHSSARRVGQRNQFARPAALIGGTIDLRFI